MEEYQPDSLVGPAIGDDLARTVNLFFEKKLSHDKLKEMHLREMRPENVDLMMRTTNRVIFRLNCGDMSHARSTDIKLQHAEQNVVKSTYPIIRVVEELKQLRQPALKPAIDKLVDGIILHLPQGHLPQGHLPPDTYPPGYLPPKVTPRTFTPHWIFKI